MLDIYILVKNAIIKHFYEGWDFVGLILTIMKFYKIGGKTQLLCNVLVPFDNFDQLLD